MPSDLLAHIQHTTPLLDGQPLAGLPSLDLDNLEILNGYGDQVALTSNDDPSTYPAWIFGEAPDAAGQIHNATACVVILVPKSELDVDAFYFYFYSYNEGPNITQVLEPLNRIVDADKAATGIHFGLHIGDWYVLHPPPPKKNLVSIWLTFSKGSITWSVFMMESLLASTTVNT